MNHNRYFTRLSYSHVPKNKLQNAITEYVKSIQRLIISSGQAVDLIIKLDKKVQELNAEHKKCKPEKLIAMRVDSINGDISLDFGFTCLDFCSELIEWNASGLQDSEAYKISKYVVKKAVHSINYR